MIKKKNYWGKFNYFNNLQKQSFKKSFVWKTKFGEKGHVGLM
jgi:hypothetical protein